MADLEKKLATARDLYRAGNYEDPVFAELAAANHRPAKALFEAMLDDPREEARYLALGHLGLMGEFDADERILKRLREIVVDDPDDLSRGEAAVILGSSSKWPDKALERAMAAETDNANRQKLFLAILRLLVSWDFADRLRGDVRAGKVDLSLESALALAAKEKGGTKASAGKMAETPGRAGKTTGRTGKQRKR